MTRFPVLTLFLLVACAPPLSAEGLGDPCEVDEDCGEGQSCSIHSGPECGEEEFCRTCEISCDQDKDCPEGTICNAGAPLPAPDALPQVCTIADGPAETTPTGT